MKRYYGRIPYFAWRRTKLLPVGQQRYTPRDAVRAAAERIMRDKKSLPQETAIELVLKLEMRYYFRALATHECLYSFVNASDQKVVVWDKSTRWFKSTGIVGCGRWDYLGPVMRASERIFKYPRQHTLVSATKRKEAQKAIKNVAPRNSYLEILTRNKDPTTRDLAHLDVAVSQMIAAFNILYPETTGKKHADRNT